MIEFGKITGDMDGHYIEVQMRTGEHLYAPIVVMGNRPFVYGGCC